MSDFSCEGSPRNIKYPDIQKSLNEIPGVKLAHSVQIMVLSVGKNAVAVHLAVGRWQVMSSSSFLSLSKLITFQFNFFATQFCETFQFPVFYLIYLLVMLCNFFYAISRFIDRLERNTSDCNKNFTGEIRRNSLHSASRTLPRGNYDVLWSVPWAKGKQTVFKQVLRSL